MPRLWKNAKKTAERNVYLDSGDAILTSAVEIFVEQVSIILNFLQYQIVKLASWTLIAGLTSRLGLLSRVLKMY